MLLAALALLLCAQEDRNLRIRVERKVALVIGNSGYTGAPLKNLVNDEAAIESALKRLGFDVTTVHNADLRRMRAAIDEFADNLGPGAFAFFYFAGHGMQIRNLNYLVPVDFAATSADDVLNESYPADRMKDKFEGSGARLRVLVLDASRNNPWKYSRDGADGLAPMTANAEGTLIAYMYSMLVWCLTYSHYYARESVLAYAVQFTEKLEMAGPHVPWKLVRFVSALTQVIAIHGWSRCEDRRRRSGQIVRVGAAHLPSQRASVPFSKR